SSVLSPAKVVVDSIFGAGLTRDVDGVVADMVRALNERPSGVHVIAVDVPSGIDGDTGAERGIAVRADETVTFFRLKPGHVLLPGRRLCGPVTVADIGIPSDVLIEIAPKAHLLHAGSGADIAAEFPWRTLAAHKYVHGHVVVVSGPAFQTGAARLAARGALRAGAGLVTVASPTSSLIENAAHLTAIMLRACTGARDLTNMLADKRKNTTLIGPGAGSGSETAEMVLAALGSGAAAVLDADALTSFAGAEIEGVGLGFTSKPEQHQHTPAALFEAIRAMPNRAVVMTPHEGEFARLFGKPNPLSSKLDRARDAAAQSGATIVLKGADTVIAGPQGIAAIDTNAPPWLATAGSGDVLAGYVAGLLAQGMPAFEAACAAVWLHGECANVFGPGLIAEDLPEMLPRVLSALHAGL
ncbi:MAG: NAD(P)H-hydrate dehydratase, partial [Hyphomicrobiaceae bacterium]